jgi:hypothetical protein
MRLTFQGSREMQQRRILKPVRAILDMVSNNGDLIEVALTHSGIGHRLQINNLLGVETHKAATAGVSI